MCTFIVGFTSLVPWMSCRMLFLLLRRPPVYSCHTHATVCRHRAARTVAWWVYLVFSCWENKRRNCLLYHSSNFLQKKLCVDVNHIKPTWSSSDFVAQCVGIFGHPEARILCSCGDCLSKVSVSEEGSIWRADGTGPAWRDIILFRSRPPSVDHGAGHRALQVAHAGRRRLFKPS